MKVKDFFLNLARGAVIGVGVIIPGVSGGTIAVLLNIYERLIDSISSLKREFAKSVEFLVPVVLGIAVAVAAMYFPIKFALKYAPLPTVLLFVGLMIGSFPQIIKDGLKQGFKPINIPSAVLPLAAVVGICFIPGLGEADLSATMPVYGYFLLIIVGALASCALVVPGISGSMLLLILGYYNSVLNTVSALKTDFGHSILVLALFGIGIVAGFFTIAKLMKLFLTKYPRGTYWAIIGFVAGSVPAIFITFGDNFPVAVYDSVQIAAGAILFIAGIIATYALTSYAEARRKKSQENK